MKKWQIILIAVLIVALAGFGIYKLRGKKTSTPNSSPKANGSSSISEKAYKEYTLEQGLLFHFGLIFKFLIINRIGEGVIANVFKSFFFAWMQNVG